MNVTRHNYESFFLMYADNELFVADRIQVEQFVKNNPDLQEELMLIMNTVLPDEPLPFKFKESLYKNIVDEQVQEKLLLHLDNELLATEMLDLEKIILTDKTVAAEWQLLQATKLYSGDRFVFANKETLYRYNKSKLVYFRILKFAAAAIIIGMGFYAGLVWMQTDNNRIKKDLAKKPAVIIPGKLPEKNITANTIINKKEADPILNAAASHSSSKIITTNNIADKNRLSNAVAKKESKHITAPADEKNMAARPVPKAQNIIPESIIHIDKTQIASLVKKDKPLTANAVDKNIVPLETNDNARLAMLDTQDANTDNKILFVNEEQVTRTKAGGFLRKFKRLVERNTKLKPGDEIRIAGFSFAVK